MFWPRLFDCLNHGNSLEFLRRSRTLENLDLDPGQSQRALCNTNGEKCYSVALGMRAQPRLDGIAGEFCGLAVFGQLGWSRLCPVFGTTAPPLFRKTPVGNVWGATIGRIGENCPSMVSGVADSSSVFELAVIPRQFSLWFGPGFFLLLEYYCTPSPVRLNHRLLRNPMEYYELDYRPL